MAQAKRFDRQTFQEWVNRPGTKAFLRLLKDQRDLMADQWARGQEMSPQHQTKALLFQELSTLNWADVDAIYEAIDKHAEVCAQADAPPAEETESGAQ